VAQWSEYRARGTRAIYDLETRSSDLWPPIVASPKLRPSTRRLYEGFAKRWLERYRTAILVAGFAGLRLSEVCGLEIQNIGVRRVTVENQLLEAYGGARLRRSSDWGRRRAHDRAAASRFRRR
jgi:integrase